MNIINNDGNTPLNLMILFNKDIQDIDTSLWSEFNTLLLSNRNFNINIQDRNGNTLLHNILLQISTLQIM
jgi:ankyrin repeat protein